MSSGKKGRISVLLKHSELKQKKIAKKLNISAQNICAIRKKLEIGRNIHSSRSEKCGRKRKITFGLDRKIKSMALKDKRASCKKLSIELTNQDIIVDKKTIINRLLERELKAYRPRKKFQLTRKMKHARYQWALQHEIWTSVDWLKVRHLTKIVIDYRTVF